MLEAIKSWWASEKTSLGNTFPVEIESILKRLEKAEAFAETAIPQIENLVGQNTALGQQLQIAELTLQAVHLRLQTLEKLCNVDPDLSSVGPAVRF